jgi:tyrosyl-tRNA synthetase
MNNQDTNSLTIDEKYNLITRDLEEIVSEDKLKEIIKNRPLKIYWGTAPTGKPSLGYFFPMYKIADFLKAGCEVTILFADLHGFLDNMKTSFEKLAHRTKYYELLIKEILKTVKAPLEKLKFVKGSDFQTQKDYTLDVYKLSALTNTKDTQKAGAQVVKQIANPKMSNLLYPILQSLDEVYLDVDAQFGGTDQRKIFMFAREFLPKIGYEKRIHLMNPLVPGLTKSGKMSSSEPNSKIDFDDSDKIIMKKIRQAYCVDGECENNALLGIVKHIIFRKLETENKPLIIKRDEKWGGDVTFNTFSELEKAFLEKTLASIDLKNTTALEIIELIKPIRETILKNESLLKLAYD